jgi:hypothetical protein
MPRLEDMMPGEKFDPARSQEAFRLAMSDHASMIVLPSLLASVRKTATHIKLEVSASGPDPYEDVAREESIRFFAQRKRYLPRIRKCFLL